MGQCASKPGGGSGSVLEAVASNNLVQIEQILQEKPFKVLATHDAGSKQEGRGLWHVASMRGNIEAMQLMKDMVETTMERAAAAGYIKAYARRAADGGLDPFHSAGAQTEVPSGLKKLLELGCSSKAVLRALVNQRDARHQAPLHLAAMHGHTACIQLLLTLGADPWAADSDCGHTPLHYAAAHGRVDAIGALLSQALPAAQSSQRQEPNTAKTRLVDVRSAHGFTPLHYAVWGSKLEAMRALISFDAFICARSVAEGDGWLVDVARGSTPLHLAALRCDLEASKALLAAYVHEACIYDLPLGAGAQHWQSMEEQRRRVQEQQQREEEEQAEAERLAQQAQQKPSLPPAARPSMNYGAQEHRAVPSHPLAARETPNSSRRGAPRGPTTAAAMAIAAQEDCGKVSMPPSVATSSSVGATANREASVHNGSAGGPAISRENDGQRRRRMEPRQQANMLRQVPLDLAQACVAAMEADGSISSRNPQDVAALLELLSTNTPLSFLLDTEDLAVKTCRLFGPPRLALIAAQALQSKLQSEIKVQDQQKGSAGGEIQILAAREDSYLSVTLPSPPPVVLATASAAGSPEAKQHTEASAIITVSSLGPRPALPEVVAATAATISKTSASAPVVGAAQPPLPASCNLPRSESALLPQPRPNMLSMVNSLSSMDLPSLACPRSGSKPTADPRDPLHGHARMHHHPAASKQAPSECGTNDDDASSSASASHDSSVVATLSCKHGHKLQPLRAYFPPLPEVAEQPPAVNSATPSPTEASPLAQLAQRQQQGQVQSQQVVSPFGQQQQDRSYLSGMGNAMIELEGETIMELEGEGHDADSPSIILPSSDVISPRSPTSRDSRPSSAARQLLTAFKTPFRAVASMVHREKDGHSHTAMPRSSNGGGLVRASTAIGIIPHHSPIPHAISTPNLQRLATQADVDADEAACCPAEVPPADADGNGGFEGPAPAAGANRHDIADMTCGICLESPCSPDEGCEPILLLAAMSCGHQLCTGCAAELSRMYQIKPARCPYCRAVIGGFGLPKQKL